MGLTYLGSLTVGACVPAALVMNADLLVRVQAELSAALALSVDLQFTPPSIALSLEFAIQLVASIQAQIALGIELPSISLQLSAAFALVASLQLQLDLLLTFKVALGTAGVHAYAFEGQANQMGGEITAALAGGFPVPGATGTDHTNALVLATTVPAAWAALGQILKTS